MRNNVIHLDTPHADALDFAASLDQPPDPVWGLAMARAVAIAPFAVPAVVGCVASRVLPTRPGNLPVSIFLGVVAAQGAVRVLAPLSIKMAKRFGHLS